MTAPTRVAIIGCGVVGAAIAYELSLIPTLEVAVFDRQAFAPDATPAATQTAAIPAATPAALGVMMAIISHKTKGRAWTLRALSLQRYETLIPELEVATGLSIPYNRDGIVNLVFDAADWPKWQRLQATRHAQNCPLELWSVEQLRDRLPALNLERVKGAVYSPRDRQVNPIPFTQALITAAEHQGAQVYLNHPVQAIQISPTPASHPEYILQSEQGDFVADWVIMAAGLGTVELLASLSRQQPLPQPPSLQPPLSMIPVLGQALELELDCHLPPLPDGFQPVINGADVHLVPLGTPRYWVGATVEFPPNDVSPQEQNANVGRLAPQAERLEAVLQAAIAYCPPLRHSQVRRTWSGLRPRPQGQPAPVIQPLPHHPRLILATGHYRNGVLLAPATALTVKEWVIAGT